ncbi:uncharacterized protein HD556DRAFT_1437043 [Suillus plorans]|uniref:Uncharacterized protein n=1 Tax=Suillus plorans TaxID=116603 RepID=A0A9P7DWU6_9AGAM|nr:uncharacterized protein HD556DRAFT_1437043 [Suillus plorans]KAG1804873.1 hypothetical protein HD556DRAFT_1437043 [Suillus plorans]
MDMPVVVEVVMRLWTFAPDEQRPTGSRIYQTSLKSLRLLPLSGPPKTLSPKPTEQAADPKGKRKADSSSQGGTTAKKSLRGAPDDAGASRT